MNIIQINEMMIKIGDFDKKIPYASGLVTPTVLSKKISAVENIILDTSSFLIQKLVSLKKTF